MDKHQTTHTKHQRSSKHQAPSSQTNESKLSHGGGWGGRSARRAEELRRRGGRTSGAADGFSPRLAALFVIIASRQVDMGMELKHLAAKNPKQRFDLFRIQP